MPKAKLSFLVSIVGSSFFRKQEQKFFFFNIQTERNVPGQGSFGFELVGFFKMWTHFLLHWAYTTQNSDPCLLNISFLEHYLQSTHPGWEHFWWLLPCSFTNMSSLWRRKTRQNLHQTAQGEEGHRNANRELILWAWKTRMLSGIVSSLAAAFICAGVCTRRPEMHKKIRTNLGVSLLQ